MKPPISDPFEAPDTSSPEDERIFRVRFWRCFLVSLLVGLPVGLSFLLILSIVIQSQFQEEIIGGAMVAGLIGGIVAGVLESLSMYWLTPVKVGTRGLKSSSFWSVSREVEWSQIHTARFFWLGLPYLLISTPQKRNFIWLPLILRDAKGFARAVEELAPADNPLRLLLQKREF